MKKITFLLVFFLFLTESKAQVAGYSFSQSTETYIPVIGNTASAAGDDGSQNNIPIGFTFVYGSVPYESFSINVNGWIRLGQAIGGNSWVNALNNNAGYSPLIAAYWDDHNRNAGSIAYNVSGTIPNRVLEIGWDNVNISTGGSANPINTGSFKMRLHETSGLIDFVYGSLTPGNQLSASIGLNDAFSFLSVTPTIAATASFVAANNTINDVSQLPGQKFTFTPQPQCSGAPNPGNTIASVASVCFNSTVNLSLQNGISDSGISYQWQSSLNGIDYADIQVANGPAYVGIQSQSTYYQCIVSCGANSTISTPVQVMQIANNLCYCIPTYTNGVTDGDLISNVVIAGTTLSNNTGTSPINPSYTYYTGQPNYTATLVAGVTYQMTVSVGTYGQQEIAVWIDYNDDIIFGEDEKIGFTQTQIPGSGSGTFTIALDCNAVGGTHRMRIRDGWNVNASTMNPCNNYGYGETEDYDITIVESTECQTPTGLVANEISTYSAELNWNIGCGHVSWDVYVVPGHSPAPNASTTPTFSGLTANSVITPVLLPFTGYDFYVRANCNANGTSEWSMGSFTTLQIAVANDECGNAFPLIPGANFAQNALVATNVGATKSIGAPSPTCGIFGFGGDVWFSIVVPSDGNITIETQSNLGSQIVDTALAVYTGACSNLVTVNCNDDIGATSFSQLALTGLTPGETIYARVWEYANDTFGTFQVSAWNTTLKTKDFDDAHFELYPNPVTDFLNLSYNQNITDVAVFNLLGQQVFAKNINANQSKFDLSQLAKGAYLVKVNAGNQTKTIKIIKD